MKITPKKYFVLLAGVFILGAILWMRREPTFNTPTETQLQQFFPTHAREVFENSATWKLFSLDPQRRSETKNDFHGFAINGQTAVRDAETRASLKKAFFAAIADSGMTATCFSPRHGLRATHGNDTVDIVICFSCGPSRVYLNDKVHDTAVASESYASQKVWDRVLDDAGIATTSR